MYLPPYWKSLRVKWLGQLKGGAGFPHDEQGLSNEDIPFFKVKDIAYADSQNWMTITENTVSRSTAKKLGANIFPRGTIVFAKVGAALLLNRFRLLGQDSCIDNNMIGFVVDTSYIQLRFILHALSTLNFAEIANPGAVPSLNEEQIGNLCLSIPPLDTQRRIADYLDAETAQIDALIAEKERMLALLTEKRAALVSRAVTRGLDPAVPLKSSGLEWLGDIPVHWEVKRAKQLFTIRDERSESGDEELLSVSHITGVTPRAEKEVFMFKAESMIGYKLCLPGDLAVNTLWAWMGAMGVATQPGIVSPDYHVYVSKGELLPAFVEVLCRSKPFIAEVVRYSKGVWSSRLRLYPEAFFDIRFPVPPQNEQQVIVSSLARERTRTSELETDLYSSLSLLKERRSALITAAVTGQLERAVMAA